MGKSDPFIFDFYRSLLPNQEYEKVACLGNQKDNTFTASISCKEKHFFDLALDNWNINDDVWNIKEKYDLIVCTRCAYFAKKPDVFINKCLGLLKPHGIVFLDWGLGDHWRFDNFKVGWVKDGEHEFAYKEDNFLWSAIWHDSFLEHPEFIKFQHNIKKFGYSNVKDAIFSEVPVVLDLSLIDKQMSVALLTLWKDLPQLYVGLLVKNEEA